MYSQLARPFSRRQFLSGLTLGGTAGLLGLRPAPVAAEPPPETRRLRLIKITGICVAPQYVADYVSVCLLTTAQHHPESGPSPRSSPLLTPMTAWSRPMR